MRLVFVVAFVALASCASAQTPKPEPQPRGADSQPANDPRGTNESPLIVKVQPAPKTDQETAKEQAKEQEEASSNRWTFGLALLTAGVAVLQLIGLGAQAYIAWNQNTIIEGQTTILKGQEASMKLALCATKDIERAYVDVSLAEIPEGVRNLTAGMAPTVRLKVENAGRTPGQVVYTVSGLCAYAGALPATPPYEDVKPSPSTAYLMPGGCIYLLRELSPMSAELLNQIQTGQMTLWLTGYVRYTDKFGRTFQRGFIRRYAPQRAPEKWIMDDAPGYDYDRQVSEAKDAQSQPQ